MQYRSEIDGLRAVAVLPVMLFHAGVSGFSGGFVGVDIFFVISGFLITNIIMEDLRNDRFSFADFYERRARRILPALFFVMGVSSFFAFRWMTPDQLMEFSAATIAIGLFSSNFLFWQSADYFAPSSELNPLLHTWSLAVEEQFYIFFPVLLLVLIRRKSGSIVAVVAVVSLFSLVWAEYFKGEDVAGNFYLLPSRAWELGIGALCALVNVGDKGKHWLSMLGFFMIVGAIVCFDENLPHPSFYTLLPVLGTGLILLYGTRSTLAGRVLSLRPLVFVGLISYSAYLWHQPVLAFARIRAPELEAWQLGVLALSLPLMLAYLSWQFVEGPFRKKGSGSLLSSQSQVGMAAFAVTLLFVSGAWLIYLLDGVPERRAPAGVKYSELDIDKKMAVNQGFGDKCEWKFTLDPQCRNSEAPLIAVWGDSYAMQLVNSLLASPSYQSDGVIQLTKSACSPLLDVAPIGTGLSENWAIGCLNFNQSVREWLEKAESVKYVVMSSSWGGLMKDSYLANGSRVKMDEKDLILKINETADFIRSQGKAPVLVSPAPSTGKDLSLCPVKRMKFGGNAECGFLEKDFSEAHQAVMRLLLDSRLSVPVVNLEELVCDRGVCSGFWVGNPVYRDKGHLSIPGSKYLGESYDFWSVVIKTADDYEKR